MIKARQATGNPRHPSVPGFGVFRNFEIIALRIRSGHLPFQAPPRDAQLDTATCRSMICRYETYGSARH